MDKYEVLYSKLREIILSRNFAVGKFFRTNFFSNGTSIGKIDEIPQDLNRVLRLHSLICEVTEDILGADECYLKIKVDGTWRPVLGPRNMKKGDTWDLNIDYKFGDKVELELWEKDSPDPDDLLGRCILNTLTPGGTQVWEEKAPWYVPGKYLHRYTLTYSFAELSPAEVGPRQNTTIKPLPEEIEKKPDEEKYWYIAAHTRENPLIATGQLMTCLAVEHLLGSTEAAKILRCALQALGSLYKFHGNHFDGYIIRWDAVASDHWTTIERNGVTQPDGCLNFLTDSAGNLLYCTPFDHPGYVTDKNTDSLDAQWVRWNFCERYRHWEPSTDEINGLLMGYNTVYRLVDVPDIRDMVKQQVNNLADYLAEHSYLLVRPLGGFTARGPGAAAQEYPFSQIFQRITGNPYTARHDWLYALEQAGMWTDMEGDFYARTDGLIRAGALVIGPALAPVMALLGVGTAATALVSLPDCARTLALYSLRSRLDMKGTMYVEHKDSNGNVILNEKGDPDQHSGSGDEARGEFMATYLLSRLPARQRFELFVQGAAMGLGKYGNKFPMYTAMDAADLPGSPGNLDIRNLCNVWFDQFGTGSPRLLEDLPEDNQLFATAVGVLLSKGSDWEEQLVTRLDKYCSLLQNDLSGGDLQVSVMSALALAWLYRKNKEARGETINTSGFPVLPTKLTIEDWPAPAVPESVIKAAKCADKDGPLVPLHAIQRGRDARNLIIKNGAAELFMDDVPPEKPAEPEIYVPPKLVIENLDGVDRNIDFGDVTGGHSSTMRRVRFRNAGVGIIDLVGEPVGDGDFSGLSLLSGTSGGPGIARDNPLVVWYDFVAPSDRQGRLTGKLTQATTDLCNPIVEFILTANVLGPELKVDPPTIDFGEVELNPWGRSDRTVYLTNVGDATAFVQVQPLEDPAGQFFLPFNEEWYRIEPNEQVSLDLAYEPNREGPAQATLVMRYGPGGASIWPHEVKTQLKGRAFIPKPHAVISPRTLDFGVTPKNVESRKQIRIENHGQRDLNVTRLQVAGSPQLYIKNVPCIDFVCDLWIPPGSWQDIDIVFLPTTDATTYEADLYMESNDPEQEKPSAKVAELCGATSGASIMILPEVVAFSKNLVAGRRIEIPVDVTVQSIGTDDLTVNEIRLGQGDQLQQLLQMFEQASWPLPQEVVARILDELRRGRVPAELKAYLHEPRLRLEDLYPFCLRGSALTSLPEVLPRNGVLTFQVVFRAWCIGYFDNTLEILSNAISGPARIPIAANCRSASIGPRPPLNPRGSTNLAVVTVEDLSPSEQSS